MNSRRCIWGAIFACRLLPHALALRPIPGPRDPPSRGPLRRLVKDLASRFQRHGWKASSAVSGARAAALARWPQGCRASGRRLTTETRSSSLRVLPNRDKPAGRPVYAGLNPPRRTTSSVGSAKPGGVAYWSSAPATPASFRGPARRLPSAIRASEIEARRRRLVGERRCAKNTHR